MHRPLINEIPVILGIFTIFDIYMVYKGIHPREDLGYTNSVYSLHFVAGLASDFIHDASPDFSGIHP